MHDALKIQEILAKIFFHLGFDTGYAADLQGLAFLARTCRSFKEPALDVLWKTLTEASPLARCLPSAIGYSFLAKRYLFRRQLTQTEWNVLQSYTRRIEYIGNFDFGLDWESVKTFLNPLTTGPLLPNLRKLALTYTEDITLSWLPLPSLVELSATFSDSYPDSLNSLPETHPHIRTLSLSGVEDKEFDSLISSCVCRWRNLQNVACVGISLDTDALMHLCRMPALTRLSLDLRDTSMLSGSPLVFPNLGEVEFEFASSEGMLRLLHTAQLPAVTSFTATTYGCHAVDVSPLLIALSTSTIAHMLETLEWDVWRFTRNYSSNDDEDETGAEDEAEGEDETGAEDEAGAGDKAEDEGKAEDEDKDEDKDKTEADAEDEDEDEDEDGSSDSDAPFCFADLQPCMLFDNLRCLKLDIDGRVALTESQLLTLASAWPKLEEFSINPGGGWGRDSQGGITPGGLIQFFQMRPLLTTICLFFNTQGYTEVPASHVPKSLELTFRSLELINVIDSVIEEESVPAMTAFLSGIAACASERFCLESGYPADESFDNILCNPWDTIEEDLRSAGLITRYNI